MLWPGHKLQSMSVITNNLVTHQQLAHCALDWGQQNINTDIITRNKIFAIQSPDIHLSAPQLLIRVVPHMDQMDRVLPYLAELGALHQRHGVAKQHIDLLGLAFCAAIRGVVQVTGQLGYYYTICGNAAYLPDIITNMCVCRAGV